MRIFVRTETRAILWPGHGAAGQIMYEHAPAGSLRRYVDRIRVGTERFDTEQVERVLPDGSVQLLFTLGDSPAAHVVGSGCGPTTIRLSGVLEHVGVQLRPGAISAVLGVPAAEVSGREIALEPLWGPFAAEVLDRIASAPLRARSAVAGEALLQRLRSVERAPDARAAAAVERILAARGDVRVRELSEAVGVGERRLEQIFHRDVGLSPKALCRVARFRSAVDFVHDHHEERSWTDAAHACGFYDQAHMVNEFRDLAGISPGALADFGFFQSGSPRGG